MITRGKNITKLINKYKLNSLKKEKILDESFWNERYSTGQTGWDIGMTSRPIKEYTDSLEDRNIRILIPGCGNAYDAEYFSEQGFNNIHLLDISTELMNHLTLKFKNTSNINLINRDFFSYFPDSKYDLIIEQTFFCSLDPELRESYAKKMQELLKPNGRLVGVLFDRKFEFDGPPFGGSEEEYRKLFGRYFDIKVLDKCYNSIPEREGTESFINLINKQ